MTRAPDAMLKGGGAAADDRPVPTLSRLIPGALAALALAGAALAPPAALADRSGDGDRGLSLTTRPASDVTDSTATLNGVVQTGGRPTAYRFVYGPGRSYGATTETRSLAPGTDGPVAVPVSGLGAGTRYHFRLLAWHTDKPTAAVAADRTFTTAPAPASPTPTSAAAAAPAPPAAPSLPPAVAPAPVAPPPAPVLGQAVVVAPVAGSVRVKAPGAEAYTPLGGDSALPVGALVDARAGTVRLTSALDGARTQAARLHGALFEVRQAAGARGMTDIVLRGPALACARRVRAGAAAVQRRKPPVRRLWASDRGGRFRTHGRNSVATVRGTRWVTTETCAGTRTTVTAGAVAVRDLRRKRTVVVRAGHSYLARRR